MTFDFKHFAFFRRIILIILAVSPYMVVDQAKGESWRRQSLEYMDTQFWIADDPQSALAWSSIQIDQLPADSDIIQQIKIANLGVSAAVQLERFEWIKEREDWLRRSWEQAYELELRVYYLNMGQCLATYLGGLGRSEEAIKIYERVLKDAREFNDTNQVMFTLAFFGQYYRNIGKKPEALRLMKEAFELANSSSDHTHPYFRAVTLLTVIITLQGEGLVEDGDSIMEKSLEYLEAENLRSVTSILAYNMATTFSQGISPNFTKARHYANKARDMAQSVDDTVTQAAALMQLAAINNKQGRFADALQYASDAVELSHGKDPVWEAYGLREKAESMFQLGRPGKALLAIDKALSLLPDDFQERRADMFLVKSRIQEKMGEYQGSLRTFQAYHQLITAISKGREEENFAKTKADMAFQAEEQKNLILKQQVQIQASKIQAARQLTIAATALIFFLLLVALSLAFAIRKSRQTARARLKMQRILELIEEGILTIGPDLKVQADYSPYLTSLYPDIGQRVDRDAISLLFPDDLMNAEGRSMIREALRACLGDSMLSWELNCGKFPAEIVYSTPHQRIMAVHWQPLLDSGEKIQGFLVSLRDVTSARKLEESIAAEQRFAQGLETKMKELLTAKYADACSLVEAVSGKLGGWLTEISTSSLSLDTKRELHTYKGVARSLGLKDLSSAIHDLESALQSCDTCTSEGAREKLSMQVGQYERLIHDIFGQRSEENDEKSSLLDILGSVLSQVKMQMGAADIKWDGVEVLDYVEAWPSDLIPAVESSLIHGLTNSADHGYILPKKEGREPGSALFRIEAHEVDDTIQVIICDRGVGLNLQKLDTLAQKVKFVPTSSETLADVVFLDGATTTTSVSDSSGRGVGMAAIRATCRASGGDAQIRNNEAGPGTVLTLQFKRKPLSA
jgi:tetratricopeptide (TPR) repeat protein/HPt (histidine-containing phosphotransfer) domain-containing protein